MSIAALNYIQPISASPTEKLLLWAIANRADNIGRCWPSRKKLIEDTGLSLASIKRGLGQLERKGILRRTEGRSEDGHKRVVVIELVAISGRPTERSVRGSQCAPREAHADTGVGLAVIPDMGSQCAPLYKEEPKLEPKDEPLAQAEKNENRRFGKGILGKGDGSGRPARALDRHLRKRQACLAQRISGGLARPIRRR